MAGRLSSKRPKARRLYPALIAGDYRFSEPLKFIVDDAGNKTAVIIPVEVFNLMLDHMKALALTIERWDDDSLTPEELDRLFADYGVVRH